MKREKSQQKAVLEYLIKNGSITSMEAFKHFGCTRLSAKIFDFRKEGYVIDTVTETTKNRFGNACCYAKYVFVKAPKRSKK